MSFIGGRPGDEHSKLGGIFMRLVVVSNRLPFTVSFQDGTPVG
jgi:hypothetical protein